MIDALSAWARGAHPTQLPQARRLLIKNLPRNPSDQEFVRAIVEISRVFDMAVIAEWVEDQETVDLLREFKVAYGQGWHFGKPVPVGVG